MRRYTSMQVEQDHHGGVVIMGNFDGVHCGHKRLIEQAKTCANQQGCPLGVITFDPHPRLFFSRDKNAEPFLLTPGRLKEDIFQAHGVDFYVSLPFDEAFSRMQPRAFIDRVLISGLRIRTVVVGEDFGFANRREGTVRDLHLSKDFETLVVSQLNYNGDQAAYSSSKIREHLKQGNIRLANRLLGHPFSVQETVFRNLRTGDGMGFPTANLRPMADQLLPHFGVYAGRAILEDGRIFDAAINWGVRPTIQNRGAMYEAHLMGFEGELYDQQLRIALLDYVRPEKKFSGLDELSAQIIKDIAIVKSKLQDYPVDSIHGQPVSPEMSDQHSLGAHQRKIIESAVFRRMIKHFQDHPEVQNIDLMILADFCRNCLSNWYLEAAQELGLSLSKEEVREHIYGMPYAQWKQRYQTEQSPKKMAILETLTKKRRAHKQQQQDRGDQ